jgi:hypothetical protein
MQICAMLDRDGEALYRHQISAVNPDASILKGPFNEDARAAIGLPRSWYVTSEWPEGDQVRLLQEKYLSGPSYTRGAGEVLSPTWGGCGSGWRCSVRSRRRSLYDRRARPCAVLQFVRLVRNFLSRSGTHMLLITAACSHRRNLLTDLPCSGFVQAAWRM